MQFNNIWKHFKTITNHKLLVMDYCFKIGLIKQGLMHDLSKYSPEEFMTGVKYYQGYRSPNAAEKIAIGYSRAWLHHKGRNKHHFEYWIDYSMNIGEGLIGNKMPLCYVLEMVCDRIAASRVYQGQYYTDGAAWEYYCIRRKTIVLNNDTKELLETLLIMLRDEGEKTTFGYMRWLHKNPGIYEDGNYIKV